MCEKFVDRQDELKFLENAYDSGRAELIIVYGRRRVGKTELVKKSIEKREHIYFFAEETLEEENLRNFRALVAKYLKNELVGKADVGWEELFRMLRDENVVIVIDEFPNLIKESKGIVSKFQKIWDQILYDSKVKLVLLGSSISVMESQVLGYRSPLYGRRTGQIHLRPLRFAHVREFFPNYSTEEVVRIFGLTDGIPAYIKEVQYRFKMGERLEEVFLPNKPLFEEADYLLRYEIRDPVRYAQILKAIAMGYTRFGEIVNFTGFPNSTVSQYLSNLQTLHIVEEEYPVGEPRKRNARYRLADNYFTFYFRFIYPNKSLLLEGKKIPDFERKYNQYLGHVFERIAREFIMETSARNKMPFFVEEVGRWWSRGEEIDLVAINRERKKALLMVVKWSNLDERDVNKIMGELMHKTGPKSIRGYQIYYGIFAKNIENKGKVREKYIAYDLRDFSYL